MKNKILKSYKLIENIDEQFKYNCEKMDRIYKEALKDIRSKRKENIDSYLVDGYLANNKGEKQ